MFGRQHVRVVRKSRGPESAAAPDASLTSLGRCVPPLSGCPLSLQPSTNLALVCRFLSSRDLLSAYKVSRALSAAAASPLTFQHESEWRIDHADKGVETIGPAAVCTGEARLRAAMQSRLFRAFRILKIRADAEHELGVMLQILQDPDAPKLHVLQIECSLEITVAKLSGLLQFPFLRVLSLRSTLLVSFEGASFAGLPRLEVFQLSHTVETEDPFISSDLISALKALTDLRTCVFRTPLVYTLMNEATESTTFPDVLALARLEAEVPQLEAIHWLICWSQEMMMAGIEDARDSQRDGGDDSEPSRPLPVLRTVRSALVNEVRLHFWPPGGDISEDLHECGNMFLLLPQLTELRAFVRDEPRFHDDCARAFLMQIVAASLPLTSLTLLEQTAVREAGQSLVRFCPASFPSLTSLSCNWPLTSLRDFAHMPRLHTLKDLKYPADEPERVKVEEPALCFPSLTCLHIDSGLDARSLYNLIARLPKLKSVASKLNTPQDPQSFITAGLALIVERETERVQLEKSAKLLGGWNLGAAPAFSFVSPSAKSSNDAGVPSSIDLATYNDELFESGAKATSAPAKSATVVAAGSVGSAAAGSSSSFAFASASDVSPFSFAVPAAAFSAASFGSSSFGSSPSSAVSSSSAFAFTPFAAAPSFAFNPPPAAASAAPSAAPSDAPFNPFAIPSSSGVSNPSTAAPFSGAFNFGSIAAALPNTEGGSQPPASQ